MKRLLLLAKTQERKLTYHYNKNFIILSFLMVIMGTFFSVMLLYRDTYALLLYFMFTFLLTIIFFFLKFYLYLRELRNVGWQHQPRSPAETDRTNMLKSIRLIIILLLVTTLFSFLFPVAILQITGPYMALIIVGSIVVSVNLSEIFLFVYISSRT